MKNNCKDSKNHPPSKQNSWRKTLLWIILSIAVASLSIAAVLSQASELSLRDIAASILKMKPAWLAAAIICMLGYIISEACAIKESCSLLGTHCSAKSSLVYSSADIYFSAITPSATGGQPASACIMVQDGIQAMKSTAALIMNLSMYTFSVVIIGLICLLTRPAIFLHFGILSRILIIVGYIVQTLLVTFLFLLIRNEKLLSRMGFWTISLLKKIHLIRNEGKIQEKFCSHMEQYRKCADMFAAQKKHLWKVFLFEFLQRASQISITMCIYMAMGGGCLSPYDIWVLQNLIFMGSNYMPIPGGMGVTDYLMLNGFSSFLSADAAVNLAMISRSLSFYVCILLCGLVLLVRFAVRFFRRNEKSTEPISV